MALSPRVPFEVRCRLLYWYWRRSWPSRHPTTFNQKLFWKMLKDRRPLLTTFADKVAARDFVAQAVGPEVLTQLYAVVTDPAELDPARLPTEFVVKPTHASGLIWIVSRRVAPRRSTPHEPYPNRRYPTRRPLVGLSNVVTPDTTDWDRLVATCRQWLALNYSDVAREWAYRNIPPRILVEELLLSPDGRIPTDYKFFVFHGRVRG